MLGELTLDGMILAEGETHYKLSMLVTFRSLSFKLGHLKNQLGNVGIYRTKDYLTKEKARELRYLDGA